MGVPSSFFGLEDTGMNGGGAWENDEYSRVNFLMND